MTLKKSQELIMSRLKNKAHLIMLAAGLLNVAVLPFWQLPITPVAARAVGYALFGLGMVVLLLSLLALKGSIGGEIEPVTELVTNGIYGRLRHPLYLSFAICMLALDLLFASILGILVTFVAFLPSMAWRARLEEQALERRFGEAWRAYVRRVPSLLLWDFGRKRG
ncbi:MAG TPA: isoprenylcysteine carboxylmethyltransferase family protein [Anaerolineae bacterium]|nr:isoprenylcysteine carboxylmethyltransferase family protein [Anaerolineae bacterium]